MKRTKVQDKRLSKLIAFLRELPRKQFDFSEEVTQCKSNGHICATVGCAIGWTPKLFPSLVKWEWSRTADGGAHFCGFTLSGVESASYIDVARELLGCHHGLFYPGEQQNAHVSLHALRATATPKQVAKTLEEYQRLVPVA